MLKLRKFFCQKPSKREDEIVSVPKQQKDEECETVLNQTYNVNVAYPFYDDKATTFPPPISINASVFTDHKESKAVLETKATRERQNLKDNGHFSQPDFNRRQANWEKRQIFTSEMGGKKDKEENKKEAVVDEKIRVADACTSDACTDQNCNLYTCKQNFKKSEMPSCEINQNKLTEIINSSIKEAMETVVKQCSMKNDNKIIARSLNEPEKKLHIPVTNTFICKNQENKDLTSDDDWRYTQKKKYSFCKRKKSPAKYCKTERLPVKDNKKAHCKTEITPMYPTKETCSTKKPRKRQKSPNNVKADNRKMTGSVNIYICSESNEHSQAREKERQKSQSCTESNSETVTDRSNTTCVRTSSLSSNKLVCNIQRRHQNPQEKQFVLLKDQRFNRSTDNSSDTSCMKFQNSTDIIKRASENFVDLSTVSSDDVNIENGESISSGKNERCFQDKNFNDANPCHKESSRLRSRFTACDVNGLEQPCTMTMSPKFTASSTDDICSSKIICIDDEKSSSETTVRRNCIDKDRDDWLNDMRNFENSSMCRCNDFSYNGDITICKSDPRKQTEYKAGRKNFWIPQTSNLARQWSKCSCIIEEEEEEEEEDDADDNKIAVKEDRYSKDSSLENLTVCKTITEDKNKRREKLTICKTITEELEEDSAVCKITDKRIADKLREETLKKTDEQTLDKEIKNEINKKKDLSVDDTTKVREKDDNALPVSEKKINLSKLKRAINIPRPLMTPLKPHTEESLKVDAIDHKSPELLIPKISLIPMMQKIVPTVDTTTKLRIPLPTLRKPIPHQHTDTKEKIVIDETKKQPIERIDIKDADDKKLKEKDGTEKEEKRQTEKSKDSLFRRIVRKIMDILKCRKVKQKDRQKSVETARSDVVREISIPKPKLTIDAQKSIANTSAVPQLHKSEVDEEKQSRDKQQKNGEVSKIVTSVIKTREKKREHGIVAQVSEIPEKRKIPEKAEIPRKAEISRKAEIPEKAEMPEKTKNSKDTKLDEDKVVSTKHKGKNLTSKLQSVIVGKKIAYPSRQKNDKEPEKMPSINTIDVQETTKKTTDVTDDAIPDIDSDIKPLITDQEQSKDPETYVKCDATKLSCVCKCNKMKSKVDHCTDCYLVRTQCRCKPSGRPIKCKSYKSRFYDVPPTPNYISEAREINGGNKCKKIITCINCRMSEDKCRCDLICVRCYKLNDECKCSDACANFRRRKKSLICIHCKSPRENCTCRAPVYECSYCGLSMDVCNCQNEEFYDIDGRPIVTECNDNQKMYVSAWQPNQQIRRYFSRTIDGFRSDTIGSCHCRDKFILHELNDLPYQRSSAFSNVMSELQQKMSQSGCCARCRNDPCCCRAKNHGDEKYDNKKSKHRCSKKLREYTKCPGIEKSGNTSPNRHKRSLSPDRTISSQDVPSSNVYCICRMMPCICNKIKSTQKKPRSKCYYCKSSPCICNGAAETKKARSCRCSDSPSRVKEKKIISCGKTITSAKRDEKKTYCTEDNQSLMHSITKQY